MPEPQPARLQATPSRKVAPPGIEPRCPKTPLQKAVFPVDETLEDPMKRPCKSYSRSYRARHTPIKYGICLAAPEIEILDRMLDG